ncbi:MAG: hypothetical protein M3Y24_11055 [Acidobacteriota bacterium]|nr:hypothetical protein [Acidobacteriota bacterium]
MRLRTTLIACLSLAPALKAQNSGADSAAHSLPEVRRIYVAELVGTQADALRELLIASLASTKLFVITDNAERADAVLKGAADDQVFTDSHDIEEGISTRATGSRFGSGSTTSTSRSAGGSSGLAISDNEFHHSKERKHEAYAAVRLCNKNGDVIWSTTQESLGAKFRGASADVASKVAHQLMLDMDKERRGSNSASAN